AFNSVGSWSTVGGDTGALKTMANHFNGAVAFNQDLWGWDTGAVTSLAGMFQGAVAFNNGGSGSIGGWDTGAVTTMANQFNGAVAFNQDLGGWDIRNVTTMSLMFQGLCLSPAHYDAILQGWGGQAGRRTGVPFHGGFSSYTAAGAAARAALSATAWTLTDGGLDTATGRTSGAGTEAQVVPLNFPVVNVTFSYGGNAPVVFSGLPPGVTGTLSGGVVTVRGTPTAAGVFAYAAGCGAMAGTITVSECGAGAASAAPTLCVGTVLTPVTHATSGNTTGIGVPSGLPGGVTASWAGNQITLSGTPTDVGRFDYQIPLTGVCVEAAARGTITVLPLPVALVLTGSTICALPGGDGTVSSSTSQVGVSYQLYDAAGLALGGPQAGTGGGLTWAGLPAAAGYRVIGTGLGGCVSTSNPVEVVNLPSETWGPDGEWVWDINDALGTAGGDRGWESLQLSSLGI
ncbi:MAG: BspA family leucine-rich repeat surface protein, partial [Verrucomicrobiota bacterium]